MENSEIILTYDQKELLEKLGEFLKDNKCFFGLYGPAGSGKSFTIGHFIKNYNLYDKIVLSGTTNNACRVLEESLEKLNPKFDIVLFNTRIESILKNISFIKNSECLFQNLQCNFEEIIIYVENVYSFITKIQNKFKNQNYILEDKFMMKLEINKFLKDNEFVISSDISLNIILLNNEISSLFSSSKYIRTIHSLLSFEQIRNDEHKIIFVPSKSIVTETFDINSNKKLYEFTPKLTCKDKKIYENCDENGKLDFENDFYKKSFSNLSECKIIIIDESSMLKELEYKYIIYICKILKIKIIFLGDKYQLPPVDDSENNEKSIKDLNINTFIDFSPAVKIKNSYTLTTIKRTENPVLQEVYKSFRDLVEKVSENKVKIQNIQFTKSIKVSDSYQIKMRNDIHDSIQYVQSKNHNNIRILCFSNTEVEKMNKLMRNTLFENTKEPYIKDENLLVTNYMNLPDLNTEQITNLEFWLNHENKNYFNFLVNKLIGFNYKINDKNDQEFKKIDNLFKLINIKFNGLRLYTGCLIKIIKIYETQIFIKEKLINISIVIFSFDCNISFFFSFKNQKDNDYVKMILKKEKENIKITGNLYKLHKCNYHCKDGKHSCDECEKKEMCIHLNDICENDKCKLMCKTCDECNKDCEFCIKQHKNNYITNLWNSFILKEHLLDPSVNYSYATTVHKSQGQSIDNVIVCEYNIANCILYHPDTTEMQKFLLYPTCMYTAITRAKNILIRLK